MSYLYKSTFAWAGTSNDKVTSHSPLGSNLSGFGLLKVHQVSKGSDLASATAIQISTSALFSPRFLTVMSRLAVNPLVTWFASTEKMSSINRGLLTVCIVIFVTPI